MQHLTFARKKRSQKKKKKNHTKENKIQKKFQANLKILPDQMKHGLIRYRKDFEPSTCYFYELSFIFRLLHREAFNDPARSSRLQMFFKIGFLKNFSNFTGKHLRLFLIKVQLETSTQVFSCDCKIFKNTFFLQNTSRGCFCPAKHQ